MIKIGMVVRLIDDVYYGTNKETDHVFVTNIYDDGKKFDGIGITEYGSFTGCTLENWDYTMEGLYTKSGHKINVKQRENENEKCMYDFSVDGVGYMGVGLAPDLQRYLLNVINNEYGDVYK